MGAQDVSVHKDGAHTGDVSAEMLRDCACEMVLIGHSERRTGAGEGGDLIMRKLVRASSAGLRPLLCVGETKAERDNGQAQATVDAQLLVLKRLAPEARALVAAVAYEPVWAIGTGVNATLAQIEEMHAFIGKKLHGFGMNATPILYGGSVTPENSRELLNSKLVDGVLVGAASINYDAITAIDDVARKVEIVQRNYSSQLEPPPPPEALALLFEHDVDDFKIEFKNKPPAPAAVPIDEIPTSAPPAPISAGSLSRYENEMSSRKPTQPLPRTSQGRIAPVSPISQGRVQPIQTPSQGKLPPSKPVNAPLPGTGAAAAAAAAGPKPTTHVPPKAAAETPTVEVIRPDAGAKTDKPGKPEDKPKTEDKSTGQQKKANKYDETDRPSWV
jgi:triosephosphate isomerase